MTSETYYEQKRRFVTTMLQNSPSRFQIGMDLPILHEDGAQSFDHQYVEHCAWAARKVREARPLKHVDIGSSLYFVALVSAFVPVIHFDYRPPDLKLDGLSVGRADITRLPFADGSIMSLSCLHTVEHIGLGRYGDPIDPDGDLKAMDELKRVLAPGGQLLFAVPIGWPTVFFNAHRVYDRGWITCHFAPLVQKEFFNAHATGCYLFERAA